MFVSVLRQHHPWSIVALQEQTSARSLSEL
jgi:hypothetical protein